MAQINIYLQMAIETEKHYNNGLNYRAALREASEKYIQKAPSLATKQGKEHNKTFNDIITDSESIDNGEVFDINTGKTIREL